MPEEKKNKIPLLITRGLVAFPNNAQTIEAGRDFSINACEYAQHLTNNTILMVAQKDYEEDQPNIDGLYEIGTFCQIVSCVPNKGYLKLKINPLERAKIYNVSKEIIDGKEIYLAEAQILKTEIVDDLELEALVRNILSALRSAGNLTSNMPKTAINQLSKGINAEELSDVLSTHLPINTIQKQSLLEELNLNKRLLILLGEVDKEKEIAIIDRSLQEKVRQSAEKSQKEYFLREKMKAIKEELGEEDDQNSNDSILKRLEKEPFPDYVKTKIKAEIRKFDMMPQASLEASLIKSYIDLMMSIPWYQKTDDMDDLKHVQKVLDEDHYGLDKVKKRIIEYLAVKKMTGSLKSPILCFYGPPGCGKTSLGKSIARALGRKFFKASLGGISDEAEIRGHRRTYVGSMPGRIISGMKKCGTTNPVFLLDEVDKLASSYKGDPASALLEVLDPEQNFAFNDNYVEEPYDLSDVLFIATANYLENIPAPLRDRLELIEVNSYTEPEKIQIAMHHLIKKQMKANGLDNKMISFNKESIAYIIERYTREAGVRELERQIASIMRKAVVEILSSETPKKILITPKEVKKYLSTEIFDNTKKDDHDQIGVVTGLAYTQYGGDILPIEVNYFPGKGNLILTGKLGEVMKESASIALDYVKANSIRYNIDPKLFMENDIHIHVPEGAVPKDGPSAGVALTTAIYSCFRHLPVDNNVAMTGEVTLRGNVLPIGGLREKSLAALRSGIKTIIVPIDNKKSVDELPDIVKTSLNIVYASVADDAIKVAIKGA